MANAEKCVCCGAVIPEGRQVCPSCEGKKMANEKRLIDAYQFRGKHEVAEVNGKLCSVICYADIVNAPTVDAVEVVRCKDCVYGKLDKAAYYHDVYGDENDTTLYHCLYGFGHNKGEHFCSYGERRGNGS